MDIIVIDDELASLNTFLINILDSGTIKATMFMTDPLKSLDFVASNKVDAAFLDINMPIISGIKLAKMIIEKSPLTKIIFISGYAQDESNIKEDIGENLLGFCHKPYDKTSLTKIFKLIETAGEGSRKVEIRTFGSFDVFVDGEAIKFTSAKAKELLALLVDGNGAVLSMSQVLTALWEDKNIEHSKRLYRDAVFRLRHTLKENGISELVGFMRAQLFINKEAVQKCDLWDFLCEKNDCNFYGTYLQSYSWSVNTETRLCDIAESKN